MKKTKSKEMKLWWPVKRKYKLVAFSNTYQEYMFLSVDPAIALWTK